MVLGTGLRLLHVIANAERRGGGVFAEDLAAVLTDSGVDQRVAVVRRGRPDVVSIDLAIDVLGSDGRWPGARIGAKAVWELRSLIRDWKPDVIQAHGGEPLKYVIAADPHRRPPVVYRRIGGAPPWITGGFRRMTHAWLMGRATMIVAVAEALRQETIDLFGVNPEKIRTIPNGVRVARLEPSLQRSAMRHELDITNDAVVTVSLGAMSWEKDPFAQLEIADRILDQRPAAIHLFVGDGPMRGAIEEGVERRGIGARCRVVGSRSDVGNILAASDVFLFASRADGMEGMPATVIEAGMAGVPVAGYSIMGVPEVVVDGVTGLLAPSGDIDALTRHALDLVSDQARRIAMGSAARDRCRSCFDLKTIAPRYLELYEQVLTR